MRNIILRLLILSICLLAGCNETINTEEITTFDEKIIDGKIEIDGVLYDIENTSIYTFEYTDGKLTEKFIEHDDGSNSKSKYVYKKNLLVEEINFQNDSLNFNKYYTYDKGNEIKTETIPENGEAFYTETVYGDNSKEIRHYSSKDTLSNVEIYNLNDDEQISAMTMIIPNTEIVFDWIYDYDDEQLISSYLTRENGDTGYSLYEYNNLDDLVSEYQIARGEKIKLFAKFYENEYDENLEIVRQTIYQVRSEIKEDQLREY